MQQFEYKVLPAPNRGKKAKGVKTIEARFAFGVEELLNEMAAEGWEFQRAEMLPSEERSGLTGSKTNWRNLLVFRRALTAGVGGQAAPVPAAAVTPSTPEGATAETAAIAPGEPRLTAALDSDSGHPQAVAVPAPGEHMPGDEPVADTPPNDPERADGMPLLSAVLRAKGRQPRDEDN